LAQARKIARKILDFNNQTKFNVMHPSRGTVEDLYFERQSHGFCMLHTVNNALGGEYVTYEAMNPFIEKWTEEVLGPSQYTPEEFTEEKKLKLKIKHGWNPAYMNKPGYEFGETDQIVYDMTGDTMKKIVNKGVNKLYTTVSLMALNAFLEHNYGITTRRVIALRDGVDYHYLVMTDRDDEGVRHAMAYRNGYILDSNYQPFNYTEKDIIMKGHTLPTTDFKQVVHYAGLDIPYGEVYGAFQFFFVKQGECVPEILSDFIDHIENPTPQQIELGKNLWTGDKLMRSLPKPFIMHKDKSIINKKGEKHYVHARFVTPAVRDYFTKKYGDREATVINLNDIPISQYTHVLAPPLDISKLPPVSAEVDSKAIIRKYEYDEKKQKKKKYMLNAYQATYQNLEKAKEDYTKYGYEKLDFSDYQKTIDPIFKPVSKTQKFHMNFVADSDTEEEEKEDEKDESSNKGVMIIPSKKTNNIDWGKNEDWYDKDEEYDKYKNESIKKIPPLKKKNNVDVEDPFWDDFFAEEEEKKAPPKKKIKVTKNK
jgi:hypothetical protein